MQPFQIAAAANQAKFLAALADVSPSLSAWARERIADGECILDLRERLRDAVEAVDGERANA